MATVICRTRAKPAQRRSNRKNKAQAAGLTASARTPPCAFTARDRAGQAFGYVYFGDALESLSDERAQQGKGAAEGADFARLPDLVRRPPPTSEARPPAHWRCPLRLPTVEVSVSR
jgi:hypothetical protein